MITPPKKSLPLKTIPTAPPNQANITKVSFGEISESKSGHRIVLYGPGGIGKTTLATLLPGPVRVVDADESLSRLRSQLVTAQLPLPSTVKCSNWRELRASLQADGWGNTGSVVLDTGTKIEEWAIAYTLATVKHEKGHVVHRLEDYGFGKGYQHVFETWLGLLNDLDRLARQGINVVIIAHDCVATVPNPEGDDWIRYEPRLQNPSSGKASIRLRVKEWADHVLFLGYDVVVEAGVGKGAGTRTIYPCELPHCMAKSRTTQDPVPVEQNVSPWHHFIK